MENKIKHLEFVQAVITRMASNSFLLKGWCIILASALLGLAAKDSNGKFTIVVFFPVVMFWLLDVYYLRQERLFRKKYDEIRQYSETKISLEFGISTTSNTQIISDRQEQVSLI